MMSGIRGKDTKPEIIVRRGLHAQGLRFRLHDKRLPGKPDLVFPKYRSVIFVHGCFWHGHDCPAFKWPKTREAFWREKITANVTRDVRHQAELTSNGWRIALVWECATRSANVAEVASLVQHLADWIMKGRPERGVRIDTGSIAVFPGGSHEVVGRS